MFHANKLFAFRIRHTESENTMHMTNKLINNMIFILATVHLERPAPWTVKRKRVECGWRRGQNIALPLEFNEGQRYRSTSDVPMAKYRESSTLRRVRQFPRSLGGYLFSLLPPVMHLIPCPFTALHRLILIIFPSLGTSTRLPVRSRFVHTADVINSKDRRTR